MTFSEELIITVVDKALIGGLLLLGGLFVNRFLETLKGQQALRNELMKLRDAKQIDYHDRQLSQFYWPIYIRLHLDSAVWEKILDKRNGNDEVRRRVGSEIEKNFILPNHEEVVRIIQSNIHLMDGNSALFASLLQYVRHVAIYRALRSSGCEDKDPIDLGEPWPSDLLAAIREAANSVQRRYDSLLKRPES